MPQFSLREENSWPKQQHSKPLGTVNEGWERMDENGRQKWSASPSMSDYLFSSIWINSNGPPRFSGSCSKASMCMT